MVEVARRLFGPLILRVEAVVVIIVVQMAQVQIFEIFKTAKTVEIAQIIRVGAVQIFLFIVFRHRLVAVRVLIGFRERFRELEVFQRTAKSVVGLFDEEVSLLGRGTGFGGQRWGIVHFILSFLGGKSEMGQETCKKGHHRKV